MAIGKKIPRTEFRSDNPVNPQMLILARQLRGLTLEEVSEQSGLRVETLMRYETEGGVLPINHIYRLARGYEFPIPFFQQEGELHPPDFLCMHNDFDPILHPLQELLDALVGEDVIAEMEIQPDGFYIHWYESDENRVPVQIEKLGNTALQAERKLRKRLKVVKKGSA